jgi:hypothetical protein
LKLELFKNLPQLFNTLGVNGFEEATLCDILFRSNGFLGKLLFLKNL